MTDNTILLVEDNPDDVDLTLRALAKNKILNTVAVARDGAQALELLFEKGLRPQLILLDLKLPKLDGHEVLRRIRENPETKMLPVVVLTSSKEDVDVVESYSRGANSYIQKPVDFDQFLTAVGQLGLYWLVLNFPPPKKT
jgi:two-component system, response regulator